MIHGRAPYLLLTFLIPALVRTTAPAHAADAIPVVKVTPAGPDRMIPLDSPFYLTGEVAANVQRVQAFVVRKKKPWLLSQGEGPSCSEVGSQLTKLRGGQDGRALDAIAPGVRLTSNIWDTHADYSVLVPPNAEPTNPPAADDTAPASGGKSPQRQFTILVVNEESFFLPGSSFCVLLWAQTVSRDEDTATLADLLIARARKNEACAHKDTATLQNECRDDLEDERDADLKQALTKVSPDKQATFLSRVMTFEEHAFDLVVAPKRMEAIATSWSTTTTPSAPAPIFQRPGVPLRLRYTPPPDTEAKRDITRKPPESDADYEDRVRRRDENLALEALARATVLLLAHHGALLPMASDDAPLRYYSLDGKIRVEKIDFLADGRFRVTGPTGTSPPLTIDAKKLRLSGSDFTLNDLFVLMEGSVPLGERLLPVTEIPSLRAQIAQDGSESTVKTLSEAAAALLRFDRLLARMFAEETDTHGTPERALRDLATFLRLRVRPCRAQDLATWGFRGDCGPADSKASWPGYAKGQSPLGLLGDQIEKFLEASAAWSARETALAIVTETYDESSLVRPIPTKVEFSQDLWVFSYVTPVIGRAVALNPDFPLSYAAVQVHFVPNLVESPQWSGAFPREFLRAFALEFGMATGTGSFGPDGRFQGWGTLPPLFAGLAVHIIPYTSLTFGAAIFERVSTVVPAEKPRLFVGKYVGFNVQINIPDAVLAVKGRGKAK